MKVDGKKVNISSIVVDGVDRSDYPDFCDAYVDYAEYEDGTPLTDAQLDMLTRQEYEYLYEIILDKALG